MKKIILPLLVLFTIVSQTLVAQTPQAFKYQAIARDNSGNILANQNVAFRISILQGSISGTSVYSETHAATTNQFGLANLNIGNGTVASGVFSSINWGSNTYFVKTEFDAAGGTNYTLTGTSQLLSVPYALYAETTGDTSMWKKNGTNVYYNNGSVGIGTNTPHVANKFDVVSSTGNAQGAIRSLTSHSSLVVGSGGNNFDSYLLLRKGNGLAAGWSIFRKGSDNQKLVFRYGESPNINEYMAIDSIGRVGIGTSSPIYKLDVEGKGYETAIRIKTDTNASLIFQPTVNATRVGKIHQSSNILVFGAHGVANIGSIDLTAPAGSFNFDNTGAFNSNHPIRVKDGKTLEIYNTTNSNWASFWMEPSGAYLNENYTIKVTAGDVYISDNTKGIILKSPNGTCFRVTVDNAGNLIRTGIACP